MDREQELWAAANMVINRHGSEAWFYAAQRADELLAQGDVEGHAAFVAILRCIDKLSRPVEGRLN